MAARIYFQAPVSGGIPKYTDDSRGTGANWTKDVTGAFALVDMLVSSELQAVIAADGTCEVLTITQAQGRSATWSLLKNPDINGRF